ncbi:MAG: hypothetical protein MR687_00375 [Spirochaetales bacterium]|nr:hypothetical protein [Spirochaetales bacterium]
MKRFIAVLLVMGVIMTAFAETAVVPSSDPGTVAAQTNVVLDLNQNIALVWFSKGNEPTTWYTLTLPATLAQETTTWIAEGNDLYLNWNIISKNNVDIILSIDSPMVATTNDAKKIGWNVSFTTISLSGKAEGHGSSITLTRDVSDNTTKEGTAFKKDTTVYGSNGRLPVSISTENIYGKEALIYKAVITATVKTSS